MDLLKDVLLALNRPRAVVKMISVSLEMWHGGGCGGVLSIKLGSIPSDLSPCEHLLPPSGQAAAQVVFSHISLHPRNQNPCCDDFVFVK